MIRCIAFDLDGVLIPTNSSYDYFETRHGITRAHFGKFFSGPYDDAMLGKVDLFEILPAALKTWNWPGTVEEFAAAWFESCYECEPEGLEVLRELKSRDVLCIVASNQDNRRAAFLESQSWMQDFFHRAFFSCRMGVRKPSVSYFEAIQTAAGLAPNEILFIDDKLENVEGARLCGWNAEVCVGPSELRRIVTKYLE
jgi:putative hydrolase of the HAD superfamily